MIGGPKLPRSCLAPLFPYLRDPDKEKKNVWHNDGVLVISLDDLRLSWPDRELVKQLGNRLYGRRYPKEAHHG